MQEPAHERPPHPIRHRPRALEDERLQLPVQVRVELSEPGSQCDLYEEGGPEWGERRAALVVRDAPMRPVPDERGELLLQQAAVSAHGVNVVKPPLCFCPHVFVFGQLSMAESYRTETAAERAQMLPRHPVLGMVWVTC